MKICQSIKDDNEVEKRLAVFLNAAKEKLEKEGKVKIIIKEIKVDKK